MREEGKKDACKERERGGSTSPVICVTSGDSVVTLVLVPQQTTLFVAGSVLDELFLFQ